jgi:rfaE bifunctional protein kinase chain/domain
VSITKQLIDAVGALAGHRVLVIGDVMIDEYLRGEVHRISPEAPVPIVEVRERERRLGGAANTAANIQLMGGVATLIGVVGDDGGAGSLRDKLKQVGVTAFTVVDCERPTTRKTRLVAHVQQIVRIDDEVRTPIAGAVAREVIAVIEANLANADAVVISDYAKGVVTAEIAQAAITRAQRRGIPVIVDPKQRDFAAYRGATVITPNLVELEKAASAPTTTFAEIERAVRLVAPRVDGTALLVTRSADGMTLFRGGEQHHHVPAHAREVFDVTGAGDTVVATMSLALAAGLSIEQAMELASVAAGIVVSKRGTSTVTPDEIEAELRGEPLLQGQPLSA